MHTRTWPYRLGVMRPIRRPGHRRHRGATTATRSRSPLCAAPSNSGSIHRRPWRTTKDTVAAYRPRVARNRRPRVGRHQDPPKRRLWPARPGIRSTMCFRRVRPRMHRNRPAQSRRRGDRPQQLRGTRMARTRRMAALSGGPETSSKIVTSTSINDHQPDSALEACALA